MIYDVNAPLFRSFLVNRAGGSRQETASSNVRRTPQTLICVGP